MYYREEPTRCYTERCLHNALARVSICEQRTIQSALTPHDSYTDNAVTDKELEVLPPRVQDQIKRFASGTASSGWSAYYSPAPTAVPRLKRAGVSIMFFLLSVADAPSLHAADTWFHRLAPREAVLREAP